MYPINRVKSVFDLMNQSNDPFESLLSRDPFEWIFGVIPMGNLGASKVSKSPEILDKEDHYEVVVEAPGFTKEELNVSVKNGTLTISGKKESKSSRRSEIRHSVSLGENLDTDAIEAEHKDGVLTIKIPKGEDYKSHEIEIK